MTSDLIERMARAIYEDRNGAGCVPWSRRDTAHKKPYRADALAAAAIRARHLRIGTTHHDPYAEPAGDVPRLPAKILGDV